MRKLALFLSMILFVGLQAITAQTKAISGKVIDNQGDIVPGVSIVVKGTTIGTVSRPDGTYNLSVPQDATTLVFSFVGMKMQEILIEGKSVINVTLESDTEALDEVVVTALGIKRSEKALGYATQKVAGDELNEAPEANLVNTLSGRVSGVQVTNSSGAVGSSSRIVLRGASSLFGDNQPLFIVDGVAISNDNLGATTGYGGFDVPNGVADIDPNNIESMNILKGPNAAALYGVRASNGVIVITTKKGTKSKAIGVDVNQTVTFESPLMLPNFQNSYGQGSSATYFEYINGTSGDGGVDESWGPPLDRGLEFMQFTSFINNPDNPQPEPWISHPDNVKDFYETGVTSKTNVSISGGTDASTFRLSMGYSKQDGMIPFTDFEKFNVDGSASYNITEKIKTNFGIKFIKSDSGNLPSSGYDGSNVVQQTIWAGRQVDFQALKNWKSLPKALPGSTYGAGELPINWNTQFQNNPYWQLEVNKNTFVRRRTIGNFGIEADITDYLNVTGNVGIDYYTTKTSVRWAKGSAGDAPTYWRYSGNRDGSEGFYDEDQNTYLQSNMNLMMNLNKSIGESFKVNVSFGGSRIHKETTFDYRAVQLELPDLYNLSNIKAGTSMFNKNEHEQYAINSLFGTAELAFREYLFLNVTGRNDWASVLPLDNNSFFYPSFTLSGLISDIVDLSSAKIDFLKLRVGWAEVGGFGPLEHASINPSYQLSDLPWNGNTFGEYPTTLNNSKLKTQTTEGIEAGLQLRMFRSKIRLDVTYYEQTSSDLIMPVQVTRASGVARVWDNIGEIENKGIEVQLGTTVFESADRAFAVDLDFNFAKNDNQVIKAGNDETNDEETLILGNLWDMNLEAREGYAYGAIVGPSLARTEDGEVIYNNGLPVVGDTKVLGTVQADWTGGVNLGVTYKGLKLNALVDAKMGGDVYSMTTAWGRYSGILEETLEGRETGVVADGVMEVSDGVYVKNNVVVSGETFNRNAYGNDIVETSVFDASYVKLRQIALSYTIPKKLVTPIGLSGASVSAIARNLAILYKKAPHIDPETGFDNSNGQQGMEFGQLPSARSIGFSINLKF